MVTIWNLREFSELEAPVLVRYTTRPSRHVGKRTPSSGLRSLLKVGVAASMATALCVALPQVSATMIVAAQPPAAMQSIQREKPPLETAFADRFGESWSVDDEETALRALASTRREGAPAYDEEEFVNVAETNQQDSLAGDMPVLSRDRIRQIARKRRTA